MFYLLFNQIKSTDIKSRFTKLNILDGVYRSLSKESQQPIQCNGLKLE